MQLQSTTPTRFLDYNTTYRLNDIANKMRNATQIIDKSEKTFVTSHLVNVGLKNSQVNFIYPHISPPKGVTVELIIGKTSLIVDDQGKIVEYNKPFYKPWFSVMKSAKKYLTILHENFYNKDVIEKHRLSFIGFTEEGFNKLNEKTKNRRQI